VTSVSLSRRPGAWFAAELGLLVVLFVVAGLLKAGVEVPGGEVLVLGATPLVVWALVRAWRAGDPEQRQAGQEYRSWARSRVDRDADD
jgi:hypothetical protein